MDADHAAAIATALVENGLVLNWKFYLAPTQTKIVHSTAIRYASRRPIADDRFSSPTDPR